MSEPLTSLETSVYQYLLDFTAENTYQPSIRDIGARFKIKSTKTVSDLLQSLTRKGYIERDPARSRGVRLLGFAGAINTQPVPYYGGINPGEPSLAPENREGFITVDRRFLPSNDTFMIRAKGESMVGRGINDGDYLLVNPSGKPAERDIVAVKIGTDATIRTYTRKNGSVVLQPANISEKDIVMEPGADFQVLGIVCGVFRPFCDNPPMPRATLTS
ncbi:MAG: transcriptional repressor LexA [Gemmatimonadaceae bacterium]